MNSYAQRNLYHIADNPKVSLPYVALRENLGKFCNGALFRGPTGLFSCGNHKLF
jgi:hypothetical protein